MITIKNNYSGAGFDYTNEAGNCTASGDYRKENGKIVSININGQYTKDEKTCSFWANSDSAGNVNISGVPAAFLADVATEVAEIVAEVVSHNEEE